MVRQGPWLCVGRRRVYVPGRWHLLEAAADVLASTIAPADAIALASTIASARASIAGAGSICERGPARQCLILCFEPWEAVRRGRLPVVWQGPRLYLGRRRVQVPWRWILLQKAANMLAGTIAYASTINIASTIASAGTINVTGTTAGAGTIASEREPLQPPFQGLRVGTGNPRRWRHGDSSYQGPLL